MLKHRFFASDLTRKPEKMSVMTVDFCKKKRTSGRSAGGYCKGVPTKWRIQRFLYTGVKDDNKKQVDGRVGLVSRLAVHDKNTEKKEAENDASPQNINPILRRLQNYPETTHPRYSPPYAPTSVYASIIAHAKSEILDHSVFYGSHNIVRSIL